MATGSRLLDPEDVPLPVQPFPAWHKDFAQARVDMETAQEVANCRINALPDRLPYRHLASAHVAIQRGTRFVLWGRLSV